MENPKKPGEYLVKISFRDSAPFWRVIFYGRPPNMKRDGPNNWWNIGTYGNPPLYLGILPPDDFKVLDWQPLPE